MLVILGMKQNNIVIGLTGGSGSGKSVVASAAASLGFNHIDADLVAHRIMLKNEIAYKEVLCAFGDEILDRNGEIDRKKLGKIVFSNADKLKLLSSITHPHIEKKILSMIDGNTIIDGAVIYNTPNIIKACDYIISVINSDERRISFICNRDGIDEKSAANRINSQPNNEFYEKMSDFAIKSDCDIDELYNKAICVIKRCISEKNS